MEYQDAAQWIYDWQHGGDNFGALLVHLIAKADPHNRGLLRKAYPVAVEAYEDWRQTEDPEDFYKENILSY